MGIKGAIKGLGRIIGRQRKELLSVTEMFERFQALLIDHQLSMDLIADLAEKSGGEYIFDRKYIEDTIESLRDVFLRLAQGLNLISGNKYVGLYSVLERIFLRLEADLRGRITLSEEMPLVVPLEEAPLDIPELTGEKANTLAEIVQRLSMDVPKGFVITSKAYRRFLDHNDLEQRVLGWLEEWSAGEMNEQQASRQIQFAILAGVVPPDVAREIARFTERSKRSWALRSSAYGEDGELSFAGIHSTALDVSPDDVQEAYKEVISSLFSPEALSYRRQMGLLGEEAAMAVLCQEMVKGPFAGVIHTMDPEGVQPDCLVVYAMAGSGKPIVEGRAAGDRYWVTRSIPHEVRVRDVRSNGELSVETLYQLARRALVLERYFREPQEIEWSLDEQGRHWILQSRRLQLPPHVSQRRPDVRESCSKYRALISGKGVVAQAGVGYGEVFFVNGPEDMERFPEGAVLVSRYTDPPLARIVPMASAIVAERGSAAGHLATIAREFRVPALFDVEGATRILRPGTEVTLDANEKVIYEGRVKELLDYELLQGSAFEETPEFRMLRRVLRRIAPLTLLDPSSADFTPQGCKTLHDVIRFIHEKAVQELMDLPRLLKRFKDARIWTLKSQIPLGLRILDLGGGVDPQARGKSLQEDQLLSEPLLALWRGLSKPGVWSTEPVAVDFKGMMSSLTRTVSEAPGAGMYTGLNLAVVTDKYLNLHLGVGYHFNLIDTRMDVDPRHNHIYFRFVGGVTDLTRRSRRAQIIARVLSSYHFKVETQGDLVVARVNHLTKEETGRMLEVLGHLIGFTRQLDVQLKRDEDIPYFLENFFKGAPRP